jgi:hypothetical protein
MPWRCMRNGGIASRILNLSSKWRWVVSFTPRPICPGVKNLRYLLDMRLCATQSWTKFSANRTVINLGNKCKTHSLHMPWWHLCAPIFCADEAQLKICSAVFVYVHFQGHEQFAKSSLGIGPTTPHRKFFLLLRNVSKRLGPGLIFGTT